MEYILTIVSSLPLFLLNNASLENIVHTTILVLLTFCCGVITYVTVRTLAIGYKSTKPCQNIQSSEKDFEISETVISRFQQALQFKTTLGESKEFSKMIQFLKEGFKTIHKSKYVTMEIVADYSLLYTVSGSNKSLTPYMVLGHLDVATAEPNFWTLPPFSGKIKDGYIYSRGTMDFKNGVMGILEALDDLLAHGFKPSRTIYISFAHDKGNERQNGAIGASQLLQDRGLKKLEFILDQGCTVAGEVSGIALIGVTENSTLDLTLTVRGLGGHSALRLGPTPFGVLAKAVSKIENHKHPSMLGQGPEKEMLEKMAPVMNIWFKILWSNIWLFKPIITTMLSINPKMNAMIRSVHNVTNINTEQMDLKKYQIAENVTAHVTIHVHPSQTVSDVINNLRSVINDKRVEISTMYRSRIASMSPYGDGHFGYQTVYRSIQQVFQPYLISPAIFPIESSSSRYHMFTNNIYRFSPLVNDPGDEQRIHGKNERISVKNYCKTINFYKHLMVNADKVSI